MLRGGWSKVLVLLWPGENRTGDSNDSIREELRRALGQQFECHMKILVDF